jgi:hypothetical protein
MKTQEKPSVGELEFQPKELRFGVKTNESGSARTALLRIPLIFPFLSRYSFV